MNKVEVKINLSPFMCPFMCLLCFYGPFMLFRPESWSSLWRLCFGTKNRVLGRGR